MISGISSALSALSAYQKKVASSADNIANANTPGYKKSEVVLRERQPQGVSVEIHRQETPGPVVDEETSEGVVPVEQSSVELTEEIPEMMLGRRMYEANLKSLKNQNEMLDSLLDILG